MFGLELPTHFTYTITAAATIPTATSTIVTINIATIILLWHSQNYHCDPCGCYCHHHYHNFPVMTAMPEMAMPLMWVPPFLCSFCLVPSVYYLCMLVRLSPTFFFIFIPFSVCLSNKNITIHSHHCCHYHHFDINISSIAGSRFTIVSFIGTIIPISTITIVFFDKIAYDQFMTSLSGFLIQL